MSKSKMALQYFCKNGKILSIVITVCILISLIIVLKTADVQKHRNSLTEVVTTKDEFVLPDDIEEMNQEAINIARSQLLLDEESYPVISCIKSYRLAHEMGYDVLYDISFDNYSDAGTLGVLVDVESKSVIDSTVFTTTAQ